jgi:hypothetical protein
VSSLVNGTKKNVCVVSLSNLNEATRLLKEFGREQDAKDLLEYFVANKSDGSDFWNPSNRFFQRGPYEPEIDTVIASQQAKTEKPFIPDAELIEAARTFNSETIKKLAAAPIDEYYRMLKAKKGDDLRTFILSALEFRRIANASPEMFEVIRRMEEALKKVASESTLNAIRVRKYGVAV